MDGKNKDSLNAHLDCVELNCKPKYHPYLVGSRTKYNLMPFTLKPVEKTLMCEVLSWSKLPGRLASNISRCVQLEEKKFVGPKSHDCHIIMYVVFTSTNNSQGAAKRFHTSFARVVLILPKPMNQSWNC